MYIIKFNYLQDLICIIKFHKLWAEVICTVMFNSLLVKDLINSLIAGPTQFKVLYNRLKLSCL